MEQLRDARRLKRAEERARTVAEAKGSAAKGATGYLLAQAQSVLQESKKRFEALERARREAAATVPANETVLARRRREERAKADYEKRLQHAKDLSARRLQEQRKHAELKARAHKLQARLHVRPNDARSLQLLVQVVYEMNDYLAAVQVIGRALKNPELASSSTRLYILLGRCHLRFYKKDGTVPDLDLALAAYREAMRDPDLCSPVPYFELAGLLLRLGKHQMALDALGASMTIFKGPEHAAWTLLGQHNVAQILVLVGDLDGAMQLYQQLQTCPLLVEPQELGRGGGGGVDHCVLGSTRLVSVLLSVEMACLHHRLGNSKLATALLVECFDRRVRTASFLGPENGGDVDLGLAGFGPGDAGRWVSSPSTFKRLGDFFRTQEGNLALAAELYGRAAELSGWSKEEQQRESLGLVLDRAECLAELRNDQEAEAAAYFAYDLMPLDVVIVGRAARCCLRGGDTLLPEKNRVILAESLRVFKAVDCILRILRRYLARRRKEARLALGYYATKIASVIRMNLARSSTADARLQVVATARIGNLVHSLRYVWKTGRSALDMYVELWSLSVKGIQHMIRMYLFRKRVTRMSRAVTAAKALWRAHRVRNKLRAIVANVQAWLSAGEAREVEMPAVEPLVGLASAARLGGGGGGGIELLSAGVNILTNDQNLPVVQGQTVGEYSLKGKTRAARRVPPPPPQMSGSLGSAWFSSSSSASSFSSSSHLLAATASFCNQKELEEHVEGCALLGEDVPCLISIKSVKDDATVQWVPFGILPDEGVGRLLTATALVITSQTFSVADCKRLAHVAAQRGHWRSISSLIVHGTKMGPRGFSQFLALGIRHLHTLSLASVGLLPGLGVVLGQVLANLLTPAGSDEGCRLTKLYIDSEPKFGCKGVVALCKYLQYNSTLKILSFRDCQLGRECVSALASYISLSTSLEVLHLADNPALRCQDCRLLLRSVANKGLRGALRGLHLQGLNLSLDELEALYREGLHLGVGIVAPKLGFRKELQGEIDAAAHSTGTEERTRQELSKVIEERVRLHQLDTTEENRVLKELFF
jgi:tetratricopeptide (TPR) repeat protein